MKSKRLPGSAQSKQKKKRRTEVMEDLRTTANVKGREVYGCVKNGGGTAFSLNNSHANES